MILEYKRCLVEAYFFCTANTDPPFELNILMVSYDIEMVYFISWCDGFFLLKFFGFIWSHMRFSFHQAHVCFLFEDLKANIFILVGVLSESCSLFPYLGFVPMGFSREDFLRRQSQLVKCSMIYMSVMFLDLKMKILSPTLMLKFIDMCLDLILKDSIRSWMFIYWCYLLICNLSSFRIILSLLVMFPKHVLGMSGFLLYGFVHMSFL